MFLAEYCILCEESRLQNGGLTAPDFIDGRFDDQVTAENKDRK